MAGMNTAYWVYQQLFANHIVFINMEEDYPDEIFADYCALRKKMRDYLIAEGIMDENGKQISKEA